jgi:hypothetical protein
MTQRTTFHAETPLQALLLEQALLLAKQRESTAGAAPDGPVLAKVEALAVPAARGLARQAVPATPQAQAQAAEKRGPGPYLSLRAPPLEQGPGRPQRPDRRGRHSRGAGRRGALLRATGRLPGLRGAAGAGPVDWERAGGGGVQAGDRPPDEADGGTVAGTPGEPNGDALRHAS